MTRKTLLTLAVLTALSAGAAFAAAPAQDSSSPTPRVKLDANGDGAIDRSEAAANPRLVQKFDAMDKNRDGKLAREEMPRRGERGRGAREAMAALDTDQDGRISRTESAGGEGRLAGRFDEMDANKDGFIDRADREMRGKQRKDAWFANADVDKDGKLSRAEMDAARAQLPQREGRRAPMPADAKPGD